MRPRITTILLAALCSLGPLSADTQGKENSWQQAVTESVARLGHRNLIIVADAAYPIQTGAGVKVVVTNQDHESVVKAVRPLIAMDAEFAHLPKAHAPEAAALRTRLLKQLEGTSAQPIREELHEKLLKEVGDLAKEYQVVVFKTKGTTAYSSVFFTLDCGYWSAEAEKDLRAKMPK